MAKRRLTLVGEPETPTAPPEYKVTALGRGRLAHRWAHMDDESYHQPFTDEQLTVLGLLEGDPPGDLEPLSACAIAALLDEPVARVERILGELLVDDVVAVVQVPSDEGES